MISIIRNISRALGAINSTNKIRLTLLSILLVGISATLLYFHNNINSYDHYLVNAQSGEVLGTTGVRIEQNKASSLIYDDEYYKAESIGLKDKRAYVLDLYFAQFKSPLVGQGIEFVNSCVKHNAPSDCLVVAAIAKNETVFCTYPGSASMHNCWGYGGPGVHRWKFDTFAAGIERVTDVLVNQYGVEYMKDPRKMQRTFCGTEDPLCANWGNQIIDIMNKINQFSIEIGVGSLL